MTSDDARAVTAGLRQGAGGAPALAACLLCGAAGPFLQVASRTRDDPDFGVVRCAACGMTQLSPRPDAVANADYYHDNRQEIAVEGPITIETKRQKTEADTARRAEDIVALMPEGSRILDVGCGYGFIVERLSALGFDVRGLEPSRSRAALAREVVGVPLLDLAPLQSPPLELGRFDLVTLFQVLEHILDPVPFLAWLRDLISEEGSILIEVPNLDDRMVGAVPSYRDFYWQRAHVGYWTASLLRRALEAAGWTVVDTRFVQRYSVLNAAHWALTGTPQLVAPSHEVDAEFAWLDTFYRGRLVEAGETDTLIVRAVRAPESGLRAGRA